MAIFCCLGSIFVSVAAVLMKLFTGGSRSSDQGAPLVHKICFCFDYPVSPDGAYVCWRYVGRRQLKQKQSWQFYGLKELPASDELTSCSTLILTLTFTGDPNLLKLIFWLLYMMLKTYLLKFSYMFLITKRAAEARVVSREKDIFRFPISRKI